MHFLSFACIHAFAKQQQSNFSGFLLNTSNSLLLPPPLFFLFLFLRPAIPDTDNHRKGLAAAAASLFPRKYYSTCPENVAGCSPYNRCKVRIGVFYFADFMLVFFPASIAYHGACSLLLYTCGGDKDVPRELRDVPEHRL